MESADFKRWVNLRQNRRSQVTLIFNDQSSFDSLSHLQKKLKVDKLQALKEELQTLNEKIQSTSFAEHEDEGKLSADIKKCDEVF